MLSSFVNLECVRVHGGDALNGEADTIVEIETHTEDATGTHTELLEDKKALVFTRIDARAEGALKSVTDQRLELVAISIHLLVWRLGADQLRTNEYLRKGKELLVTGTVHQQFADGRGIERYGTGSAERHLAASDRETAAWLLSNHE